MAPSSDHITYGEEVTLSGDLAQAEVSANHQVDLYRAPIWDLDADPVLAASFDVGADGTYAFTFTPEASGRYFVRWEGDENYLPATAPSTDAEIRVDAIMSGELKRSFRTSGEVHLYHSHVSPIFLTSVTPTKPNKKVWIRVRRFKDGSWHSWPGQHFKLDAQGDLALLLPWQYFPRGDLFEISSVFGGDHDHGRCESPWFQFKIVR